MWGLRRPGGVVGGGVTRLSAQGRVGGAGALPQRQALGPAGVDGLSTSEGAAVDTAPLASPPPPPNPTETDTRASEVTWTRNPVKNENAIFGISASRENSSLAIYWVEKKLDHFAPKKSFSAPLAPEFIMTE